MKKTKLLSLFLCTCLLLMTACGNYQDYAEDAAENNGEIIASFSDYQYDQEDAQLLRGQASLAVAENGYYYLADEILHFYDINSDLDTALCSRVDCSHSDEDCDAYAYTTSSTGTTLACNCMDHMIAYYNDGLYMIERTEENDFNLCRYNSSFNDKEIVSTLASVQDSQNLVMDAGAALISEGYLYYFTWIYDPEYAAKDYMATIQCNRILLEKDAVPERLGEFEYPGDYAMAMGQPNGLGIYLSGDDVYFLAGGAVRSYAANDMVQYRIARYNKTSEDFSMLWSHTGEEAQDVWGEGTGYFGRYTGGEAMYVDEKGLIYAETASDKSEEYGARQNQIIRMDPAEGNAEVLYKTPYDSIGAFACDGEQLFFVEIGTDASYVTAVDLEGNMVARIQLEYTEETLTDYELRKERVPDAEIQLPEALYTYIYSVDDRYLLIGSYSEGFKGLSAAKLDLSNWEFLTGTGVVNKKDFLEGKAVEIHQIYQRVNQ